MDNKYLQLFRELTHATEISAEQVVEYDRAKGDEQGATAAETLHQDYIELYDKLSNKDFDGVLTKAEYAKLLVGSYIVANNLQDRVKALQSALAGYQTTLIPKLNNVIQAQTDEEAQAIAEKEFKIEESNT